MTTLRTALVQAAPIPLAFGDGIEKASRLAREAVEGGAQLVAFGETFLGGSMIIAPDARIVAQAGEGEETLFADLDLGEIGQGLASLDTDGHYSKLGVVHFDGD